MMMKLKMKRIAGAVALVLGMAGAAHAETTLISGQSNSGRGPFGDGIKWFHSKVSERSGGEAKFDIQWGGALFKAPAARQSIADGIADMGMVIGAYTPGEMVAYTVADLPVLGADPWVGMSAIHELMKTEPSITAQLDAQNLVYIGSYTTSAVQMICKGDPIMSLDDIKGKKVRGIGVYGKVFKELGANLVSMSYYKSYQALDTGLLDCTQGYSYATKSLKHYEVSDSLTLINWGQVGALGLFMNKEIYDGLDENLQQALMATGDEIANYYGKIMTTANEAAIADMKAGINGKVMKVHELDAASRAQLVEKGQKYIADWVANANKSGLEGERLLKRVQDLVAKYEKQRDEKGYPWAQM